MSSSTNDGSHNPIPMPPPVANTLMHLQSPHMHNSNRASLPGGVNEHIAAAARLNDSILQHPSSVINLSNSSDVVIGPMTQYQGNVTIYQYMDATVQRAEQNNRRHLGVAGNSRPDETPTNCFANCNSVQIAAVLTVVVLIAVGIGVGVHFLIQRLSNDASSNLPREIIFGNEYEDETIPNLGMGHLVIDRRQWGSSELADKNIANGTPLKHPIPYVFITHVGVQSRPCETVYNCSIKMRTLQDSAIAERHYEDLPANFYVSNDGYVYVGRGWNITNVYTNSSLAICFMGDFSRYRPSEKQLESVRFLVSYGISRHLVAPDYKLVAHNQTRVTKSPGSYVYREIIKWPRWYACGLKTTFPCDKELLPSS